MQPPLLLIIAGPNGSGKSTFAKWYLEANPVCEMIVDPDEIARHTSIENVQERNIAAGRIAITMTDALLSQRRSFAIETTLSGTSLAGTLRRARDCGYTVVICMLVVPSAAVTRQRIERRVRMGGHDIPIDDQVRRFDRSYRNFHETYIKVCHEWTLYDAVYNPPVAISRGSGGFSEK